MKTQINFGWQMLAVLLIAGAAVYFFVKGKGAVKTLVTETLNPVSDKNIVYSGSNKVVQVITGNNVDTVGTALYNATHDDCGNLKFPWQASSPCTFPGGGVSQRPPKPVFRTFGTSEGE